MVWAVASVWFWLSIKTAAKVIATTAAIHYLQSSYLSCEFRLFGLDEKCCEFSRQRRHDVDQALWLECFGQGCLLLGRFFGFFRRQRIVRDIAEIDGRSGAELLIQPKFLVVPSQVFIRG